MNRKVILARGDYPYIEKLRAGSNCSVEIVPSCHYPRRPYAVLLDSPTADELSDEIERATILGIHTRIVVVSDPYLDIAVRTFCRAVVSVRSDEGAEGIVRAVTGRRSSLINLDERELALISRMRQGPTNKELSLSMSVSERTIRRIKEGIFRKTGLVSGEQLAVLSVYLDQYSQLLTYLG